MGDQRGRSLDEGPPRASFELWGGSRVELNGLPLEAGEVVPLDELAVEVTVRVSDQHAFAGGPPAALVEQDLGVARYAAWVPVTRNLLEDSMAVRAVIDEGVDRHLRPWRFPDRPAWPTIDLFPSVTSALGLVGRARGVAAEASARVRAAAGVLRRGVPDVDEGWGE